ncbi:NAD-dependent epimerase/dehydratase family protein [Desertibaculum subflavum]|uniref:NAD-dependent epimerase/dehydratase family protein n=1 Tax=Desertibaculum subflavum TaxID=2268458 RepID=UPI0013C4F0C2
MPRIVAITGGTGFVGRHLVPALLAEGWHVRSLARRLPEDARGEEVVIGSLADSAALARLVRGADAVVHLAGAIKARSAAEFMLANRDGTGALAAAAASAGVGRFVLVSTLAAREPWLSPYAASKRAAEIVLPARFPGAWIVLRPTAVYGPGDPETLPFFRVLARGIALRLNRSEARVGMVHVADLVGGIRRALAPGGEGRIFEVDDGAAAGHLWGDMLAAGAQAVGRRPIVLPVPRAALWATALLTQAAGRLTGRPQILSTGKVREIYHASWARQGPSLAQIGGWVPGIDLTQGFRETVAWYRENGWI